jgi:hypothetical protein
VLDDVGVDLHDRREIGGDGNIKLLLARVSVTRAEYYMYLNLLQQSPRSLPSSTSACS